MGKADGCQGKGKDVAGALIQVREYESALADVDADKAEPDVHDGDLWDSYQRVLDEFLPADDGEVRGLKFLHRRCPMWGEVLPAGADLIGRDPIQGVDLFQIKTAYRLDKGGTDGE